MITLTLPDALEIANLLEILDSRALAAGDHALCTRARDGANILQRKLCDDEAHAAAGDAVSERWKEWAQRLAKLEDCFDQLATREEFGELCDLLPRVEKLEASQAEVSSIRAAVLENAMHLAQLERGLQSSSLAGVHGRNELSQQIFALREKVLAMGTLLQGSDAG